MAALGWLLNLGLAGGLAAGTPIASPTIALIVNSGKTVATAANAGTAVALIVNSQQNKAEY